MAWKALPYFPFQIAPNPAFPQGAVAWRPMLFCKLSANNKGFNCIVEADTGADNTVFPLSFAVALGLDPLSMPKNTTGGVGSSANVTYWQNIEIELPQLGVTIPIYAGFTSAMEAQGIGLLGQKGFFDRFNVSFHHKIKIFQVEIPEPPQPPPTPTIT